MSRLRCYLICYFLPEAALLLAAHRAFISWESRFRPAGVIPPRRRPRFFALFACPALTRAQRARTAAAIFARAAADNLWRPALRLGGVATPTPQPTALTKLTSRRCSVSIWRRSDSARSNCHVERFMGSLDRVRSLQLQE